MEKKIITIKIGGVMAKDTKTLKQLALELKSLMHEYCPLIVHGGGRELSEITRIFGIQPVFKNGIRITSQKEMDIVEMVLAGKINKRLVRFFHSCGLNAIGLSGADGGLIMGKPLTVDGKKTQTGSIAKIKTELLKLLLSAAYLPIMSSTASSKEGQGLNINADSVAFALAAELNSAVLIFLSDIAGILKEGAVISRMSCSQVSKEIKEGTISGGMIPKVESAILAIKRGVKRIIIGQYTEKGSLAGLLAGRSGTEIL